jgi:phage shock protein C
MYCTACGVKLDDSARFCTQCGKPTTAEPVSAVAPPKKLHRDIARKKIAGVCAGFADYFGMDLTLMRLIWVGLLLIPPYVGLIAYIVSWIVLPAERGSAP